MYKADQHPTTPNKTAHTPRGTLCDVESVYDGDTVWVVCDGRREKLRLYCIDAPEMGQKPWGKASRNHLRSIIGDAVTVESIDTDRYGRTVARLWSDSIDLIGQMISDGQAVVYPRYCPVQETSYYEAEEGARSQNYAVWSHDGLQNQPWEWRRK